MSEIDNEYCDEFCHFEYNVEQAMVLGAQIAKTPDALTEVQTPTGYSQSTHNDYKRTSVVISINGIK